MRSFALPIVALALCACTTPKKTSTTAPSAPEADAPTQAGTEASAASPESSARLAQDTYPEIELRLLNAGELPRTELRMQPKLGDKVLVSSTIDTVSSTLVNGQKVAQTHSPSVIHRIEAEVSEAQPNTFKVNWKSAYEAKNAPNVNPKELERMQARYAAEKPVQGSMSFNERGQRLNSEFAGAPEAKASWAANLVIPWPKEPVGVGARWETTLESRIDDIDCVVKSTYTLKGIKDGKATLAVESVTRGKPGPFESPDVPEGVKLELISMEVVYNGEFERDIAGFYREKGTLTGTRDLVMKIKANGQEQEVQTKADLKAAVEYDAETKGD